MLNQYHPGKGLRPRGMINVGEIIYIQDGLRPLSGFPSYRPIVRQNPWIVEAWTNRQYQNHSGPTTYLKGGHTAIVRSLRDGRRLEVSDWILEASQEVGG